MATLHKLTTTSVTSPQTETVRERESAVARKTSTLETLAARYRERAATTSHKLLAETLLRRASELELQSWATQTRFGRTLHQPVATAA